MRVGLLMSLTGRRHVAYMKQNISTTMNTGADRLGVELGAGVVSGRMLPRTKQHEVDGLLHPTTSSSTSSCNSSFRASSSNPPPPLRILFNDPDFVVVDKPHSLRMDGDGFNDTLEKRLVAQLGGSKENYKWIHQLDYATSGVICVGKNRQSAAVASEAFAKRETYKEYYAVVMGHVGSKGHECKWTSIKSDQVASIRKEYADLHNSLCKEIKAAAAAAINDESASNSSSAPSSKGALPATADDWTTKVMNENLDRCLKLLEELVECEYNDKPDNLELFINLLPIWKMSKDKLEGSKKTRKLFRKELKRVIDLLNEKVGCQKYSVPEMLPSERPLLSTDSIDIDNEVSQTDNNYNGSNSSSSIGNDDSKINSSSDLSNLVGGKAIATTMSVSTMCLSPRYSFIAQIVSDDSPELSQEDSSNSPLAKSIDSSSPSTTNWKKSSSNVPDCGNMEVNKRLRKSDFDSDSKFDSANSIKSFEESLDRFIVICPLAEMVDDFRCHFGSGESDLGRYSETIVEVLERGFLKGGQPVTKLRLIPRTGRRHQLRLHCLLMGHVILGDFTYMPYWPLRGTNKNTSEEGKLMSSPTPTTITNTVAAATTLTTTKMLEEDSNARMMLHARRLRVPRCENSSLRSSYFQGLSSTTAAATTAAATTARGSGGIGSGGLLLFDVETPDPFLDLSKLLD